MKKKAIICYCITSLIILGAWICSSNQNVIQMTAIQDPYDLKVQNERYEEIEALKDKQTYTPEQMLLIHNPYGTNAQGMYVYFKTTMAVALSYSIHVNDESIKDFSRVLSTSYQTNHEYQIIGLIPNKTNIITFTLTTQNGEIETYHTSYHMGSISGDEEIRLAKTEGTSKEEVSDGLYAILGNDSSKKDFMYLYDNDGILRSELPITEFRVHRVLLHQDIMYFSSDPYTIAAMDNLGRIIKTYALGDFALHHDYVFDDHGNILVLADDTTKDTVEDQLISVNLESGEVTRIADFTQMLPDYLASCNDDTSDTLDWLHFNTIQYMEDDSILLSSRETSTIMKVENIYSNPKITYMIGDESFWKNTQYEDLLLTKDGTFTSQCGQHSITYVNDDNLEDGQYYIYMFNNNFGYSKSQSSFDWSQLPDVATKTTDEKANSKYYKYLVDENIGTYSLQDSLDVPFSAYISSVQELDQSLLVNSGNQSYFQEYDQKHQLIQAFHMNSEKFIYRVYKYTFEGFYFNRQ